MAEALAAINTIFAINFNDDHSTFVTVANVGDIEGFDVELSTVDVTSHSTGAPWASNFATILNDMPITFPVFWDPNETSLGKSSGIVDMILNRKKRDMKWTSSDATFNFMFPGWVTKFKLGSPVKGVYTASVTVTPKGGAAPTITP